MKTPLGRSKYRDYKLLKQFILGTELASMAIFRLISFTMQKPAERRRERVLRGKVTEKFVSFAARSYFRDILMQLSGANSQIRRTEREALGILFK